MKKTALPTYEFEQRIWLDGKLPAGVDEAGRGPLAGPVFAAAVIFHGSIVKDSKFKKAGINDSKILTAEKRDELFELIKEKALAWSYASVDNETIDRINILRAAVTAMNDAVNQLNPTSDFLLIDGNYFPGFGIPFKTLVGGDGKSVSIAAASIIAKTLRDRWMIENAHKLYPNYGFDSHKGYAVKKHFEAIKEYGTCPLHRKTFLKKFEQRSLFE